MYVWILLAALAACIVAIGFFVVTVFSLQEMIEQEKKTEDGLRENRDWLRAMLDHTKALISVKRPDGTYVMVNESFETFFGVPSPLVCGSRDGDVFSPEVAKQLTAGDTEVLEEDRSVETDMFIPARNGTKPRQLYAVKSPLHDVLGTVTGVCTIATDVTERELANRERHRIFELSLDAMSAATFDGRLTLVNPQWQRLTGFQAEDVAKLSGMDLVHPDDREEAEKALERLRAGEPLVNFESRILCRDGSYKRVIWRAMPAIEEGMIYAVGRELDDAPGARSRRPSRLI